MLILHLGMPKTGTSLVQSCLTLYAREDGALLDFTKIGRGKTIAHHQLAYALRSDGIDALPVVALLNRLRRSKKKPIVVSSESFSNLVGPAKVDLLCSFIHRCRELQDVKVILVVREMKSFVESMYLQTTRFGRSTAAIENYSSMRLKWIENFFMGIEKLRREIREELQIPMVIGGFDSVAEIEKAAAVNPDTLGKYRSRVSNTAKYSLKTQTVLLHLNKIEKQTGKQLNRQKILAGIKTGPVFEGDVHAYTIISREWAGRIRQTALKAAMDYDFREYTTSFGTVSADAMEFFDLDFARLTPADIELVVFHGSQPT
jgi:hypothetical protein